MMPLPVPSVVAAAINHLLKNEARARTRLMSHAGKVACFDFGLMRICLKVEADGMVCSAADAADATSSANSASAANSADAVHTAVTAPNVTIRIKPVDLPRILQDRERAFSYVSIEGDADFANTISQLSQSIRWDVEDDLSRVVGDIAAVRIVARAKSITGAVSATQRKLIETTAEYFLEENPMLMRPQPIRDFAGDVARLRDDVERLSKRIDRLKAQSR